MPADDLYTVIIDGTAYPADLKALRQWVLENRILPSSLISRGPMPPVAACNLPELRDLFPFASPVAPQPIPYAPHGRVQASGRPNAVVPQPVPRPFAVNVHQGPFPNEGHRQNPRYRQAMGHIRRASIAGLILSGVMFLFTVWLAYFTPVPGDGAFLINPVHLLAVLSVLFLTLNFGLHFQNRVCAILLFCWMLLSAFGNLCFSQNRAGFFLAAAMVPLYLFAILGTFQYHAFRKDVARGRV